MCNKLTKAESHCPKADGCLKSGIFPSLSPLSYPLPVSLFLFAMSVLYFSSQKQIMIEQEEVPRIVA